MITKELESLGAEGYRFEINADGYFVWFNGVGLGGASVRLPRERPLHWRHRNANIRDNAVSAVLLAQRHKGSAK